MAANHSDAPRLAADLLSQADALLVAAGAGIGIDSGLPDFRGPEGFWRAYPALRAERLPFVEIANPAAFARDPVLAWGFYGHRLALYRRTVPHAGFALLKAWGEAMPLGAAVFTSNVDGQFQRAGFGTPLVECHGSVHWLQCSRPCGGTPAIWGAGDFDPDVDEARCRLRNAPPRCPSCGAIARPNVLMFGDGAWIPDRSDAQQAQLSRWMARARRPLVIEIGAGTAVPSVRHFSHQVIAACGGRLIRINPREPEVPTSLDVSLPFGALAALQAIDACLREAHPGA